MQTELYKEVLHTEDHPRRHEALPNPSLNNEQSLTSQLELNFLAGLSRLTSSPITYQPRYSPGSCLLCLSQLAASSLSSPPAAPAGCWKSKKPSHHPPG